MPDVTRTEVAEGISALGLARKPVCIHVSMRSFGHLEDGPATVIDGMLDAGCTVIVPTFSNQFEVAPPAHDRPRQNGLDYSQARPSPGKGRTYSPDAAVEPWLGAVPSYAITRSDMTRGGSPTGSFGAIGPAADEVIVQDPHDIFGPLRALARLGGWVLLMGVGLDRMTLLHLAEVVSGRRPFIRWFNGPSDVPERLGVGECSEGFPNLEPVLGHLACTTTVGSSTWRAFPAAETLTAAADAIRSDPEITHCGRECIECRDAIAGGPVE
jgi:aminoglycoside 3-N-acetyltransferase